MLMRLRPASVRHWNALQADVARHPITTVMHNGQKMRVQKRWLYWMNALMFRDDPPADTSIVADYRPAPYSRRMRIADFMLMRLPFVLVVTWLYMTMGPYLVGVLVFIPIIGLTIAGGAVSWAGLIIQQEVDGERFDLLAVTPGGANDAYAKMAAVYVRQSPPQSNRRARWPGRILIGLMGAGMLTYVVRNSLFTPPFYLLYILSATSTTTATGVGHHNTQIGMLYNSLLGGIHNVGIVEPMAQLALVFGLLNLPLVLLMLALLVLEYVQMIALGHIVATLGWSYFRNRTLVQALGAFLVIGQRVVIFVVTIMLSLPLFGWMRDSATALPNMLPYYLLAMVALGVTFVVNEITVLLLGGLLRRRMR